jgi:Winged helix-turn-helix DNA-binding
LKSQGIRREWDNPIGLGNKLRILTIISKISASGDGITIAEISKKTGLSKQTVNSLVKRLLNEGRITRIKYRYFMPEDMVDDRWPMFADYLNYLLITGSIAKFRVNPIQRVQPNWSHNDIDGDDMEGELFKIANRIGAFITYVLIEAMRPSGKVMSKTMRTRMSSIFINSSISLDYLFGAFFNMLPNTIINDIVLGT